MNYSPHIPNWMSPFGSCCGLLGCCCCWWWWWWRWRWRWRWRFWIVRSREIGALCLHSKMCSDIYHDDWDSHPFSPVEIRGNQSRCHIQRDVHFSWVSLSPCVWRQVSLNFIGTQHITTKYVKGAVYATPMFLCTSEDPIIKIARNKH